MSKFRRHHWRPIGLVVLAMMFARPALAQSKDRIAPLASEPPPAASATALLRPGETVTLRVRQILPCDGLTPGERLLSGRPPIAKGDRVLAEVVQPGAHPPRSSVGRSFTSHRRSGSRSRAG